MDPDRYYAYILDNLLQKIDNLHAAPREGPKDKVVLRNSCDKCYGADPKENIDPDPQY